MEENFRKTATLNLDESEEDSPETSFESGSSTDRNDENDFSRAASAEKNMKALYQGLRHNQAFSSFTNYQLNPSSGFSINQREHSVGDGLIELANIASNEFKPKNKTTSVSRVQETMKNYILVHDIHLDSEQYERLNNSWLFDGMPSSILRNTQHILYLRNKITNFYFVVCYTARLQRVKRIHGKLKKILYPLGYKQNKLITSVSGLDDFYKYVPAWVNTKALRESFASLFGVFVKKPDDRIPPTKTEPQPQHAKAPISMDQWTFQQDVPWLGEKPKKAYETMLKFMEKITIRPDQQMKCPERLCPYFSSEKGDLIDHINLEHIHFLQYKCDSCPQAFKTQKQLFEHQLKSEKSSLIQVPNYFSQTKAPTLPNFNFSLINQEGSSNAKHFLLPPNNQMLPIPNQQQQQQQPKSSLINAMDIGNLVDPRVKEEVEVHEADDNVFWRGKTQKEAYEDVLRHYQSQKIPNTGLYCPDPTCNYTTTNKTKMILHINEAHIGYEPYNCPLCVLKFITQGELNAHIQEKHRDHQSMQPTSNPKPNPKSIHGPLLIEIPSESEPFATIKTKASEINLYVSGDTITPIKQYHFSNSFQSFPQTTSNASDFAEYMKASHENGEIKCGDVVLLNEGLVTTKGFQEKVIIPRIVSTTPLILGNSTNNNTDKVIIAMVGQVHINLPLTMVAVPGDFIIAGYEFGQTRAVNLQTMQQNWELHGRVVGVALERSQESWNQNTQQVENKVFAYIFYSDTSFILQVLQEELKTLHEKIKNFEMNSKDEQKQLVQYQQIWNIPELKIKTIGRDTELELLEKNLKKSSSKKYSREIFFLSGFKGSGKTQLLLEYSNRQKDECPFGIVVKADSMHSIFQEFLSISQQLGISPNINNPLETITQIKDKLSEDSFRNWIIIYDDVNIDCEWIIQNLIPPLNGTVFISTQHRSLLNIIEETQVVQKSSDQISLHLSDLTFPEACQLLSSLTNQPMGQAVVEIFGCYPLTLYQLSVFILKHDLSPNQFWNLLQSNKRFILEFEFEKMPSITSIFQRAIQQFQLSCPQHLHCLQFLQLLAFFSSEPIPNDFFSLAATTSAEQFQFIQILKDHNFLIQDKGTQKVRVPSLLQTILKEYFIPDKVQAIKVLTHTIVHYFESKFFEEKNAEEKLNNWTEWFPHLTKIFEYSKKNDCHDSTIDNRLLLIIQRLCFFHGSNFQDNQQEKLEPAKLFAQVFAGQQEKQILSKSSK